tara:strand:- start:2972 stop:8137 length:5166 start_codon:yes stop_codon:yes gene_type:complete
MFKTKKSYFLKLLMILSIALFVFVIDDGMNPKDLHQHLLENSPFKEELVLNKKERLTKGLPPNKFNEQIYDLTIDPATGEHNYESKLDVQKQIQRDIYSDRYAVPGQSVTTPWYEIGPKNAAGRSRAALWDLTDGGGTRVIAGGVSGGLWKNNDITDVTQVWTRIIGVPGNLAISVIVQDPNNTSVLYAGTGESYTGGDASGNGIYKSTDGGSNWSLVFGRGQSTTVTTTFSGSFTRVEGYFAVNDIVLYDHDNNAGTDAQVFAAIGTTWHSRSTMTGLDPFTYGLFKSADAGSTFTQITSVNNGSQVDEINDLEIQKIGSLNRLWLSTTDSQYWSGIDGGRFWYSDDGTSFTRANPTFPVFPTTSPTTRHRTEIAPSQTDTDTHYVLIQTSSTSSSTVDFPMIPIIYKTVDNFSTFTYVTPPVDADLGIPNFDFTRGQSFYDLEIEVDPTNEDILYVGGIDWFRSQNGGTSWSQITKWAPFNANLNTLNVSVVHADQHGLYFKPGDTNKAIVVNDGGVAYSTSLSTASDTSTFGDREKELITLQFYTVAQSPPDFAGNDYIVGGTQDNGTWAIISSANNKTDGAEVQGGDGAATVFDQVGGHYYISNYVYNNKIQRAGFTAGGAAQPPANLTAALSIPSNEGSFINPGALDSNQDNYFSGAGNGKIRVITGLERGGTIQTFLINFPGTRYVTALEVSRHTTNTTTLFVGLSDGDVLKITNAGVNGGSATTAVYSQSGSVSDIHIGNTENDIYVTYFNYGINSNIRFTNDGFVTNSNKEGDLPDFPVLSILNNPYVDDEVIIGTELGIWRTANFTNANPTWVSAYTGMSDVPVYDMDFRGVSALDNRVVAASYGRGVYTGSFSSPNNPPVTITEVISVLEAGTASTTTSNATSVLANDTDPESDSLTAILVSNPINGAAFAFSATGTFTYTHDGSETTTDTFLYKTNDGLSDGNTVTVTINITPVNDCPVVDNPIADFTVQEDAADNVFNISNLFSDAEGNVLNYTFTNDNTGLVTVTLNTNSLTLDYIDDQTGVATVTINANDGTCSTQEVFVVTVTAVNDPPVTVTESLLVNEGGTVITTTSNATTVLANDTDAEGDPITAIIIIGSGPFNGTLSLLSSGTFLYTHNGSETTTDTFQYKTNDGFSDGNTVNVTINITPVNDCPVWNNSAVATQFNGPNSNEDFSLWFWNTNIQSLITDADNAAHTFTVTHTNPEVVNIYINPANNRLSYSSILNRHGSTTGTITISDGICELYQPISYTVNSVNDCPTLDNPIADVSVAEDDPDFYIPLANVFSDVDSNTLSYSTNIGNPTMIATSITATALVIDFLENQNGSTFISLVVSDGDISCTVDDLITVSISQTNDAPTGVEDFISVPNGSTISVLNDGTTNSVLSNDNDPESNPITAVIVQTAINGSLSLSSNGNFTYTHDGSATTTDTFTYTPRDSFSIGNTTTATIYINDLPVGVTENIALFEGGTATTTTNAVTSVLANDTDANGGDAAILTATIGTSPLFGTLLLNSNGSFSYNHDGTENFTDSFTYIPFDGKGYGLATSVSINVTPTNDPPVAYPDSITIGLGGTTTLLSNGVNNILTNDTDPDADSLTATLVTGPNFGTLVLNPGGTFSYVQNGVMNGGDSFTYKAKDASLFSNVVTVNIDITCSPCTQSTVVGGSGGVLFAYQGCDCKSYEVYVPKGKTYIFCHVVNSITISQGAYTLIATSVCN